MALIRFIADWCMTHNSNTFTIKCNDVVHNFIRYSETQKLRWFGWWDDVPYRDYGNNDGLGMFYRVREQKAPVNGDVTVDAYKVRWRVIVTEVVVFGMRIGKLWLAKWLFEERDEPGPGDWVFYAWCVPVAE